MTKNVDSKIFRFSGKSFFLTYKTHVKLSLIEATLKRAHPEIRYACVHETSDKENTYDHTHVLVYSPKKLNIRDSRFFDIVTVHPNLKRVATAEHWKNLTSYIEKQNSPFFNSLTGNEWQWNGSVADKIISHKTWTDVLFDKEIEKSVMRFTNWAKEVFNNKPLTTPDKYRENLVTLRKWQKECIQKLKVQDDRKILWVYDKPGAKGKSFLTDYLLYNNSACFFNGGRACDIAQAYNGEDIVIFDLPRTTVDSDGKDWSPYRIMEMFKDGRLFSSKYQSKMKIFGSKKVVVFANYLPDKSKLSSDRWDVWNLNRPVLAPSVLNIKGDTIKIPIKARKRRRRRLKAKNKRVASLLLSSSSSESEISDDKNYMLPNLGKRKNNIINLLDIT